MTKLTDEVRADAKRLFEELVAFARDMLRQHGEFLPFAYAVRSDGTVEAYGADTSSERPGARDLYAMLEARLAASARDAAIRAAGICVLVTLNDNGKQTTGIRILTEHASGSAAMTLIPCIKDESGDVRFGKAKSQPTRHTLFRPPDSPSD